MTDIGKAILQREKEIFEIIMKNAAISIGPHGQLISSFVWYHSAPDELMKKINKKLWKERVPKKHRERMKPDYNKLAKDLMP